MSATTVFGGGTLWLANETGVLACTDPRTSQVRARTRARRPSAAGDELLAVSQPSHVLYAVVAAGLVAISPPGPCWR